MKELGIFLLLAFILSDCKQPTALSRLETAVQNTFDKTPGQFAMAYKNVSSQESLMINADTVFHAASTMKTPVMIELFKQSREGKFSMSDSIMVRNAFYSIVDSSIYELTRESDSDTIIYDQIGEHRTIASLLYDMIIVSSNLATNLMIDLVDARKVTATMRSIGAEKIEVLRGVEDIKAFRQGLSNTTTAKDLMVIYEHLATGQVVDKQACQAMIKILQDQRFNEIIPARLPEEVKVAHKTGVITGVHHDSGIVMLPDGRQYVLVLLSKDLEDFDQGTRMLARVSKMVYDHVISSPSKPSDH